MAIDIFENELLKVWKRFNEVYGGRDVKGLECMYRLILAITGLGILKNRIKALNRQEDRKDFMRRRDIILKTLDNAQEQFNERRRHEISGVAAEICSGRFD